MPAINPIVAATGTGIPGGPCVTRLAAAVMA
jgi:hypothetical protein